MTRSLLDRQSELPQSVRLYRYVPKRVRFSWQALDPKRVRSVADLPQYLILGHLDPSTFRISSGGWTARWQGTEDNTHFEIAYKANVEQWEIRPTWRGLDGGFTIYSTKIPLDKVIGLALHPFSAVKWDSAARLHLEAKYQITVIEQSEEYHSQIGIPDGAFREILIPVSVENLRPMQEWVREIAEESPLSYPITVEAKLVFQAVNYVEGRAPNWTTEQVMVFRRSIMETGLLPTSYPAREVATDGSAAWTLRRNIYLLHIGLPFAGLTDFLSRMVSTNGPIQATSDPSMRIEWRPLVVPAQFDLQVKGIELWDQAKTTRSFLQFAHDREQGTSLTVSEFIKAEKRAPDTLEKIEAISTALVATIEGMFNRVEGGE
jgi:hypothetical protein